MPDRRVPRKCATGAQWLIAWLFMAMLATIAIVIPAEAGLSVGKELQEADSPAVTATDTYYDYLAEHVPGATTPLVDYAAEKIAAPKCDRAVTSKMHAVLIGATNSGDPFPLLRGPDNDVKLLYTSLVARGVADDDIALMVGRYASRAEIAKMFKETLERVNCGDRLLLHYGGNSVRARDLIEGLVPKEVRDPFKDVSIQDIWQADLVNQGRKSARAIGWIEGAGLFLALNKQQDGVIELISAHDLSDFITNLRNRQVDVAVTIDTSYASEADITGQQEKAGGSTVWSLDTGSEGPSLQAADYMASTPLQPNHGQLAVFYASIGDSQSVEFTFGEQGAKTTYGVFTFRLANVIQNQDSVTVRAMAESLKKLPEAEANTRQQYRVESTDPEFSLFSDRSLSLPPVDPIVITKPVPKRGAAAMEKAEVEIEGQVNWSSPVKAVLVDGKVAELRSGGRFAYTSKLKAGLNTVEIVALTADGRTHERQLEFLFEGDKQALEGEGKRYAVIIANQDYDRTRTGFDTLRTPFADADAIVAILTGTYGFVTEARLPGGATFPLFLKDATRHDIETLLYKIGLVAGEKDTVLIYFAGHGIYEEKTTIAFWVPVDAEAGVPISYLSASTISEAIQRMQANKVVIISDSCFSGALLRGGGETAPRISDDDRQRTLLRLAQRRTRILISSGNNEPVEDTGGAGHSIFAKALLTGLKDMNHDAFSARELYDGYILPLVVGNADQEPQYRPIERSGHEGGDIVFVRQKQ
ncbi:caspase family protein [Mesorhizobium qingshengii]|uniref:Caspase domain-containing protein n=1 Tax=Mesorhizobium qingshengii TaxID=1165689 RepID=A0A1G5ZFE4_9HYPH|nr:caspase family protein [Mesorhizobium qingshengii]SDA93180.1 Caspase domain-containing protein [Mesorhizobium qingshengii]